MKHFNHWLLFSATLALLGGVALCVSSCSTPDAKPAVAAQTPAPSAPTGMPAPANGAQLWAQNCGHCHNVRSPGSYSDVQWDVAMLHMRVRANLTAEEHRKILEFLKSAN